MQNNSKSNIVLFGRTGAGKSSFINYLLGSKVAPTGCGEPVTTAFDEYEYALENGISIRIFDSKGLEVDGYQDAVDEIIDFVARRNNSNNVLDWMHSVFYCININRARLETEEISFINKVVDVIGFPVHIIITHCRSAESTDKEREMQAKIRAELGESAKVYCVNSVEKRMRTGDIAHQFGRESIISDLVDLLWENTARRIASNYATQMRAGLFKIIEGLMTEYFMKINLAKKSNLKAGKIPEFGLDNSAEATALFIQEMNASYSYSINTFLDMYCLFANALDSGPAKRLSPYSLSYEVLLDDSLEDELKNWLNKRLSEVSKKKGLEALLDYIDCQLHFRDTFKEPMIFLCQKMRARVPSHEEIEEDIYKMLLEIKE